jgi:hypothetical protein
MRHGRQGHEPLAPPRLTLRDAFHAWVKAHRHVRGLDEGPTKILMAVFGVPVALDLAMAAPLTLHAATRGGQVAHAREARYRPRLQQDRQREHVPHPRHRFAPGPLGRGPHVASHGPLQGLDWGCQAAQDAQVTGDGPGHTGSSALTLKVVLAELPHPVRTRSMARVAGTLRVDREHLRHVLAYQLAAFASPITHRALVFGIARAFR